MADSLFDEVDKPRKGRRRAPGAHGTLHGARRYLQGLVGRKGLAIEPREHIDETTGDVHIILDTIVLVFDSAGKYVRSYQPTLRVELPKQRHDDICA
jgi:hypothetical protein